MESTAARRVRRRAEDVERTEGGPPMGDDAPFAFASGRRTRGGCTARRVVARRAGPVARVVGARTRPPAIDDVIAARGIARARPRAARAPDVWTEVPDNEHVACADLARRPKRPSAMSVFLD